MPRLPPKGDKTAQRDGNRDNQRCDNNRRKNVGRSHLQSTESDKVVKRASKKSRAGDGEKLNRRVNYEGVAEMDGASQSLAHCPARRTRDRRLALVDRVIPLEHATRHHQNTSPLD